MGEAFGILKEGWRPIAIYLFVFGLLGTALSLDRLGGVVMGFAFFAYFPAQYWLYQQLLTASNMGHDPRFRVFSLFFMAILLFFPIMIAMNFLYIPGIILGAKWVMSPTFLIKGEGGVMDCIGASWRTSKENTLALSLAFLAFSILGSVALLLFSALGEGFAGFASDASRFAQSPIKGMAFSISLNVLPILLMALSISAYRLLSDDTEQTAEVFA